LLEKAVLAAEDAGFYRHGGISYVGILRAIAVNLWKGGISQGGSTISQQVIKQVLLSPEKSFKRKFTELLLTRQMEMKLTKKEILAIYMSEVYLGHGMFGFEEAGRFYFNKTAKELKLEEASLLAGLVQAPEALSPLRNPNGALERRRYVLQRMVEEGFIDEKEAKKAMDAPLNLHGKQAGRIGSAPYFVEAVRKEAKRLFGERRLLRDGLQVETTLDLKVSDSAELSVAFGLMKAFENGRSRAKDEGATIEKRGFEDLPGEVLPPPYVMQVKIDSCSNGEVLVEVGKERFVVDPRSLMRLFLKRKGAIYGVCDEQEMLVSTNQAEGGRIVMNAEIGPQAAMVVLDAKSRAVLALVGGDDFQSRPFNRAMQSRRPIGSTVKPFLYSVAFMEGMDESTQFENLPVFLKGAGGHVWSPRNYEGGFDGRFYTIGEALAKSINIVAVRTMMKLGAKKVKELLQSVGIDAHVPEDLSLALGSCEASPLSLANAFAVFASGGLYDTPFLISRVKDFKGNVLLEHEERPERVLDKGIAQRMKRLLRRVVLDGTANLAKDLPGEIFGKTGTTNNSREAWFLGSDGNIVVSVLVGYDDRLPMYGATGGNTAVPIFVDFMRMLYGANKK
jgi:penicillin-binding protein 1A